MGRQRHCKSFKSEETDFGEKASPFSALSPNATCCSIALNEMGKKRMQSTIRCRYFQKASGWCVPIGGKPIINLVGKSCRLEIIRRKLAGRKTLMSTPTSSAEENSLSVNAPSVKSALADLPAQIKGDTEKTAEKLEELISELQEMIEFLRSESDRVQCEIVNYAQLRQSVASAATKIKTETVGTWKITGDAQHSAVKPLNGREKLKRWPAQHS